MFSLFHLQPLRALHSQQMKTPQFWDNTFTLQGETETQRRECEPFQ